MSFTFAFTPSWPLVDRKIEGPDSAPQGTVSNLIKVNIYPQWFKQISLDWIIPSAWGNCSFNVFSSPGPEDFYERLTPTPISTPMLVNTVSKTFTKLRTEYYVVEAILPDGVTTYSSLPSTWSVQSRTKTQLISSEIQRREYMLLSKFVGVKSFYFKKRYYGLRCHRCWNPTLEKVMDDHCPVCIGTSYEGGYFNPIPVYLQYDPTPNDHVETFVGIIEPNQITAWTISVPFMTDGDVLIRSGDWNAYKIVRGSNTELQTNTVRQTLTLTQLNRKDVENILVTKGITDDNGNYLNPLGGDYSATRFPRNQVTATRSDDYPWSQPNDLPSLPQKYSI